MSNFLNKFGIFLLIVAVLLSGSFLFFEDSIGSFADVLGFNSAKKVDQTGDVLKIAYLFAPQDLNPFSADPAVTGRLNDVYEGLVANDVNLIVRPVLAVSYGLVNDKQWRFRLRDGVRFHDQKVLNVDDVLYSFNQAKANVNGGQADLISTVDKFEKIDEQTLEITTKAPDPLLLSKLTRLPIVEKDFKDYAKPIGTGAYKITEASDLSAIQYTRNSDYWGEQPYFGKVKISAIANKNDRVNALTNGDIDFLVNVPPDAAAQLKAGGLKIALMPSLEVGFVMFNLNDKNFRNKALRVAIAEGLNKDSFLDLAYGYAKTVNQFVSNGVFGYNPDLKGFAYDQQAAGQEISKQISSFEKLKVAFFFPDSLKLLGQYFKEQLILIGVDVNQNALSDNDLQTKLAKNELPFYYLGWRSDSGDALPFLKAVIHSKIGDYGIYNGMNYKNVEVDQLIEKSETNLDVSSRLKDMQAVMKRIVEDDVVGVPLFESQSLFAYKKDLNFIPRVDSQIFPSTISKIK